MKGTLWADFDKTQVRKKSLLSMLVPDYMIIQDGAYVKEYKTETSWVQFPDTPSPSSGEFYIRTSSPWSS